MAHPEESFPDLAGESVLSRRLGHEPLAYILGHREFYGRSFHVGPGVLIPRQDTETLVETAIDSFQRQPSRGWRVLDLGTGSGCIAITLKLEMPGLAVVASDVSAAALDIAEDNAKNLSAEIEFIRSDGFEAITTNSLDAIVTNPPYIGFSEVLAPELTEFEPRDALFSGPTGLEFYELLAKQASSFLKPSGQILMEVGYRQAEPVSDLFKSEGWIHMKTVKDLAGVPRVVVCAAPNAI
jgi:release factor glutamine methyltransferase